MKKAIMFIILLVMLVRCDKDYNDYQLDADDLITKRVSLYWKDENIVRRITESIVYYSAMYKLDSLFMARLFEIESSYRYYKVHPKSLCVGLGQVNPDFFRHVLYYVDGGKLGTYLKKKNITNTDRIDGYFKRIGYGTESSCIIIRDFLNSYDGDLVKSMYIYGGFRTKFARKRPWLWHTYSNKLFNYTNY